MGLRCILNDSEVVFFRHLEDGIHVCTLSIKVNRDYRFGLGRNRSFDFDGVHCVGFPIDVDEHRRGPRPRNCQGSGNESVRDRDYLIARPDAASIEGQVQRVSART
jgi:hypothetical protein